MSVTIRLRPDGPLVVEGEMRLIDHEGNEFTLPVNKPVVALCRCGESKNKPFCDGAHKQCGFSAVELAPKPAE